MKSDAREGSNDGVDSVARSQPMADGDFNLAAPAPRLLHQAPNERVENARIPRASTPEQPLAFDPLENTID